MKNPNDHSEHITSNRNPVIKRLRSLSRREERHNEGVILIEGLRNIIAAIAAKVSFESIVYAPERLRSQTAAEALARAKTKHITLLTADAAILDALSERDASQGVIAIAQRPDTSQARLPLTKTQPLVVLYEPQDPGNIGTIARTADSAGAAGIVIIGKHHADIFDPKALRSGLGTLFTIPIIEIDDPLAGLRFIQQRGYRLIATSDHGDDTLWNISMLKSVAFVLGNERKGLPPEIESLCDHLARIPLQGNADSLNVAVAAGIFLFESVRQQSQQ